MEGKIFRTKLGSSELLVELTPLAPQANGRVLVRLGETTVLVTAVMSKSPREGGDFFPLTVDYEEKFYAAGRILGSRFVKRENRPSEEAILTDRLIDRTIRPRFDLRMRNEVQVVATVLSLDDENDADIPALLGASLALSLSDIPWDGPVAGVRIGRKDGQFLVNPNFSDRQSGGFDLVAAGREERINMIEAGAREAAEELILSAIEQAQAEIKKLIAFQNEIISGLKPLKAAVRLFETTGPAREALTQNFSRRMEEALWEGDKSSRNQKLAALKTEWQDYASKEFPEASPSQVEYLWEEELDAIVHRRIIKDGLRPDGRKPDQIRPLEAAVSVIPRVHGSGLFIRGETQALATLTLGSPGDEQIVEGMEIRTKRRFMHHYNFPPYSTGEVKPMRGPGRREIGHGALAEKTIAPLLPPKEEFPYTIRIVSEILSSNGSSSMASVCGSSLALFDAGVPVKKAVAGIAMGLMMDQKPGTRNPEPAYVILTDIQGPEDHYGDMDLKAAGTAEGINALQMDVKIEGLTLKMLAEALDQARQARLQILEVMSRVISAPKPELKPLAPRISIIKINPEKIGALIGPGGKIINGITAATGAEIDIEDDGSVFVTAVSQEAMDKALKMVKQVTHEYTPGELLEGEVTRIFNFGAMVEVGLKQEGLIHISELAPWHVNEVEDIVKVGERIPVMVRNIDEQGRLNLSLKSVPGRYSEEDIARGQAALHRGPPTMTRPDFGRPHSRPFSRPSRPAGRPPRGPRRRF